ncbi:MAG: nucleotidyltransferase family protein [Bacteroidales bacterium]|nr:nucleotidyltransferase family protein [Bacteroidales bacterium]
MTLTERQFLSLVRSGIHGSAPEAGLFRGPVDWNALYALADAQAVVPLVTDGIDHLPAEEKPSIEVLEPFLADTLATEMRNETINRFARGLFRRINQGGIDALMVKGQAVARLYPDSRHRQPGDIDILVLPEDYATLKSLITSKATAIDEEHPEILHQGMSFGSVEVELHGTVSTLMSVRLDRKLGLLMEQMFRGKDFTVEDFGGESVKTPSVLFDAVYILVHFLHHYWSGGVGVRQLIDWGLFVTRHFEDLDKASLEAVLKDLGIFRLWQTFAGLSVAHLGMDGSRIPFCTDRYSRKYEGILRYLIKSGNFGKNQPRESRERSYFGRKLHSFWQLVVCDRLRHFPEFPAESLRYFSGAFHYGLIRLSEGV